MGFLAALVSFAAAQAEAHPDILRTLVAGITAAVDQHEQHSQPGSSSALTELRAGIAAAASSAVTSLVARQTPAAVAKAPPPAPLVVLTENPTSATGAGLP